MSTAYIHLRINIARRELESWQKLLRDKSCNDCEHYQGYACNLANGVRPPPEVEKVGCDSWEWDGVPF